MIPIERQAAMGAIVLANRQVFMNRLAAAAALLGCPPGIDFHDLHAGSFGLAVQNADEAVPASIGNRSVEPVILKHPLDVKAFHRDETVSTD